MRPSYLCAGPGQGKGSPGPAHRYLEFCKPEIRTSGNADFRKSKIPDFRKSGNPEFRKSGFPEIRISGNPEILKFQETPAIRTFRIFWTSGKSGFPKFSENLGIRMSRFSGYPGGPDRPDFQKCILRNYDLKSYHTARSGTCHFRLATARTTYKSNRHYKRRSTTC